MTPPHPSPPSQRRLAGIRILLVEDDETVRRPVAKFLVRRGAEVHEATDGLEALAFLEGQHADVILADLRMPRMNGSALFAALSDRRPEMAARVLFLSGDVSQLEAGGSVTVPQDRVLVKPLELAELERRVVELVGGG